MRLTNLVVTQGETFLRQIEYLDGDGNPVDLSNYLFEGQVRPWEGARPQATFSWELTSDGKGIDLTLTADITRSLTRSGLFDWWLVSEDDRLLIDSGKFIVKQSVTANVDNHLLDDETWDDLDPDITSDDYPANVRWGF